MRAGADSYRGDIDGLRALAIVPVVAFHAGLPGFGGGFVGVDVFFVISGFLITGLLVDEQERSGRIAVADFYARRVRRLLPALSLMLLATVVGGLLWLPPSGDQQRLAKSVVAASAFLSNVFFWRQQGGYFGPMADILPLLHTWTLAVEEQFYLLWPPAMMVVAAIARELHWPLRRTLAGLLIAGIAVSVAAFLYMTVDGPGAAFYLTPCRAWELGVGALLALAPRKMPARRALAAGLALAGMAAIGVAVFRFDQDTALNGLGLALPVLGAAAVLAAGMVGPGNPVAALLGSAPLQAIGKVSYGWYLWHWPLLAIARLQTVGERSLGRDLALALIALALATLSYFLVERPIRRRAVAPFKTTRGSLWAGLGLLCLCVVAAAGLYLVARRASPPGSRPAAIEAARHTDFGALQQCHHVPDTQYKLPPTSKCRLGDTTARTSVLLWGDSTAQQLIQPLDQAGRAVGVAVIARTGDACPPHRRRRHGQPPARLWKLRSCQDFNQTISDELDRLKVEQGLVGVVLAGQWWQAPKDQATDLADLVTLIRSKGLKVVLVVQAANGPLVSPDCLAVHSSAACAMSRALVDQERSAQLAMLTALANQGPGVAVFDPRATLCDSSRCPAEIGGVIVYRDHDHLSKEGAMLLAAPWRPTLTWLTAP